MLLYVNESMTLRIVNPRRTELSGWWGTIRPAPVEVAPVEVAAVDVPRRGRSATV
jgi:hypothetical protein